jgi:hypothetical protein
MNSADEILKLIEWRKLVKSEIKYLESKLVSLKDELIGYEYELQRPNHYLIAQKYENE